MDGLTTYNDLQREKQNQILRLVTKSFYKELSSYGVETADIVKVSVNLLDYVTNKDEEQAGTNSTYSNLFEIQNVHNQWATHKSISLGEITLQPLQRSQVRQVCDWLRKADIGQTFIRFFPQESVRLESYLLDRPDRAYFGIYMPDDTFVGIIGAENINEQFKKLEMKKFIGEQKYQGKGIGKTATFLFLYYTFNILQFNKVYIKSLDTNIKNINLNSKFGFELEGILYEEAHVGSVYKDVLRMGLLKADWKRIFSRGSTS